ncbi:MAG: DUF354 domain-containing protein [Terriglobales bacterium]
MPLTPSAKKNEREDSAPVRHFPGGARPRQAAPGRKIWIDLENSPHVPFFDPIIAELERRGCEVVLTARDCFQVCELADMAGFKYKKIGHHYGKHRIAKVAGLGIRVLQMAPLIRREKPALAVSHGSRSLIALSAVLGIPSITIADYEHADHRLAMLLGSAKKRWVMTPEVVPPDIFKRDGMMPDHILTYPGIKEDVYTPFFEPDPSLPSLLGLAPSDIVVTIRPPATEAHYHNPESEKLLAEVFQLLGSNPRVKMVLLPRNSRQEADLRQANPEFFAAGRIMVPKHAVDGLGLIWYSDAVISGGGTMNREAAALGIPVYSLFRGTMGAVDKHLAATGQLVLIESVADVRDKMKIVPRSKEFVSRPKQLKTLDAVVNHIMAILDRNERS